MQFSHSYSNLCSCFEASQWFEKGKNYYLNKEYDNAIEAFTKAIALDPNYAHAYNNRGNAYNKNPRAE